MRKHLLKFILIPIVQIFLFGVPANAQEAQVSLQDLVYELIQNNPEIQAAEFSYRAALLRPEQAQSLPDPVVSFVTRNGDGNPLPFTQLGDDPVSSVGVMWEQEFPYPGKLKLSGEIAQKEAESANSQVDAAKWKAISELKQAYYEYFRSERSLEVLRESLDLLRRFEEIAEARYRVGKAIQQDVLRAQVELSIVAQRITKLEQERDSAIAEINKLLNRPVEQALGKPADIEPSRIHDPVESLQQQYSSEAPKIRSSEAIVRKEKLSVDLAKKQYKPDFMTSIEYSGSPNFPDMWEIQIGLRIPLFYKKKQQLGVAESVQNVARAEKELRAASQEVAFEIKNEFLQMQSSEKLLNLYQNAIIPQSSLALESAIASYQTGQTDFLTTVSNFLVLLDYRINYYEELSRHEGAIARLEGILGEPLAQKATGGQDHE